MTTRLKRYRNTLQLLANCDKNTSNSIVRSAKPALISCISDICHNTLRGRVKLSPTEKRKLSKYKNNLRKIANKSTNLKTKKNLIQKGGFLPLLLKPLLSMVGPLLGNLLQK